MANDQTRAMLRTRARQLADRVNSTFVTEPEIDTWLDDGGSELHDILVLSFEDYFDSTSSASTAVGTANYNLPSDFYKLQAVDLTYNGVTYSVHRRQTPERNRYQFPLQRQGRYYYRTHGTVLTLLPTPTEVGTLTMSYVPQYTRFASDSSLVSSAVPQGWEQYIVIDAAIKILTKEGVDVSALLALKNAMVQRITDAAESRDAAESTRVVDVTNRFSVYRDEIYDD